MDGTKRYNVDDDVHHMLLKEQKRLQDEEGMVVPLRQILQGAVRRGLTRRTWKPS